MAKSATRRWIRRLAVVAILTAVLGWLVWLLRPRPTEVEVVAVERGPVESTITNSRAGTVEALRRTELSPEVGGRAVAIPYREGDRVKKGAVLLELDDSIPRAQVELTERELASARAQRDQACLAAARAERELRRIRRLAEEEIVAVDALDQIENARDTGVAACTAAEAAVERAEAALGLAEVQLSKMTLIAPFDAVVADVSIELGEYTTPSPPGLPIPPVILLLDPTSIHVTAPMDEVDAAKLRVGQRVRVTIDSHRGQEFRGTVRRVSDYVLDVEAQNRTVEIEVDLDDDEFAQTLRPGTSADVEVILEVREDVLRLPTPTIVEGDKVLVVEESRIVEREVETGIRNWNHTEIRHGLGEGDLVVRSLDRPGIEAGAEVEVTSIENVEESGSDRAVGGR